MLFSKVFRHALSCVFLFQLFLSPLLLADPGKTTEKESVRERWSRIEIGGIPAGWVQEIVIRSTEQVVTKTTSHFEVRRGDAEIRMQVITRFTETADGRPIEAWNRQTLGSLPVETTWTFPVDDSEESIRRATRQGNAPAREDTIPVPAGDWLTPGQMEQRLREHLAQGTEKFQIILLDPTLGLQVAETTWELQERSVELEIDGEKRDVSRWKQGHHLAPNVTSIVDLSDDGLPLRLVTQMMGLEMMVVATSREILFGELEEQREQGLPELLISTFVKPDRPLRNPRELRRAAYLLQADHALLAENFPSTAAQLVEQADEGVRILVDLDRDEREAIEPEIYLAASTWLDHEDIAVAGLIERALQGLESSDGEKNVDPSRRAEALHRFVYDYLVEKNLNTVLATASEIARTGEGDCTEHAVLLAALLRGAEIPSRVAAGLVYAEGFLGQRDIFVYHMWTQAYLDGRWVDLDATLPNPFDAAHIALSVTTLENDLSTLTQMAQWTSLIGTLQIQIQVD